MMRMGRNMGRRRVHQGRMVHLRVMAGKKGLEPAARVRHPGGWVGG